MHHLWHQQGIGQQKKREETRKKEEKNILDMQLKLYCHLPDFKKDLSVDFYTVDFILHLW